MPIDALSVLCAQPTRDLLAIAKFLFISWWVCCFEIDASGCTWAMTPVLADPNVTAFLKILSLHRFCLTCTPTTCQLHVAENSFTLTRYVSPLKANTSAN